MVNDVYPMVKYIIQISAKSPYLHAQVIIWLSFAMAFGFGW